MNRHSQLTHLSFSKILKCLHNLRLCIHDEWAISSYRLIERLARHDKYTSSYYSRVVRACRGLRIFTIVFETELSTLTRQEYHITIFEDFLIHCDTSLRHEDHGIISFGKIQNNLSFLFTLSF